MSNFQIFDKLSPSGTQLEPIRVGGTGRPLPARGRGPSEGSGSMLLDWWQTINRHRRLVITLALAGLLASVLITAVQIPKYRAFALIELQGLNEDFLDIKSVDPNASGGQFTVESTVQTQIKIVQSEPVMIRSMDRMDLYTAQRDPDIRTVLGHWLGNIGWVHSAPEPAKKIVRETAESVHVRAIGPTRIIEITADSADPFVAALYVNTIADEYIAQTSAARSISSEKTSTWLRSQLQDLRTRLEQADNDLERYAKQSSLMFPESSDSTTGPSVEQQRLEQIQEELSKAQSDRVSKQSSYEQSQSQNPDSLPPVLDNGPIRDYQLKLADLRRQLAELSATLKPGHPKMLRVQEQIADLESTLNHERSNVLSRMRHEFESAKRREDLLNLAYQSQTRMVSSQEAKRIRYNTLKSEVESDRQLYQAMLRKVKEADFAKALQPNTVRIVNPALVPQQPVSPKLPLNLMLGTVFGIFAGVGMALFKESTNSPVRSPGQAALELETRELGVIPKLLSSQIPERSHLVLRPTSANGVYPTPLDTGSLVARSAKQKTSFASESFRNVLQSIFVAAEQGSPARLITITSPEPGDGKTMMVSNLAIAVAELRKSVLVIDCDMRRPRLHTVFGADSEPGISDLLLSDNLFDPKLMDRAMRKTEYPGLMLIPSGKFSENIGYLLSSTRLHQLLHSFRDRFDMVIIDSPPMLYSPDARILGKNSDGVVLVLRAGKTSFSAAHAACECLVNDEIPLLGTVLNDWTPQEQKTYKAYRKYYSERN